MGSKILKGTLVGGFIAWIWMFVSWTILPWHCSVFQEFSNETEVADVVMEHTAYSGIYLLPNFCGKSDVGMDAEALQKGPMMFASVRRYGLDLQTPIPYIASLFIQFIGAFFITLILLQARHLMYGSKVAMTVLIALTVGVLGHFPSWIWFGFPFPYIFVELLDLVIAWFIAGLFIAAFTKWKQDPPDDAQKESKLFDAD